jgi:hypothetical protein
MTSQTPALRGDPCGSMRMHDATQLARHASRKVRSAAALQVFFGLAAPLKLSPQQQLTLLGISERSTFFQWKKHPEPLLPKDTPKRNAHLRGVDAALRSVLPAAAAACTWLRQPNQASWFRGSPLERMLQGRPSNLSEVHRYLDALCDGGAPGQ